MMPTTIRFTAVLLAIRFDYAIGAFGANSQRVFVSTPVSNFPKRFVADCMTPSPFVLSPGMSFDETIASFLSENLSGAPVVNERQEVVGMVSSFDFLQKEAFEGSLLPLEGTAENVNRYVDAARKICGQRVEDVMSTNPTMIAPTTTMRQAAAIMSEQKLHRLPVVNDQGQLVGILSTRDVMRDLLHIVRSLPAGPEIELETETADVSP